MVTQLADTELSLIEMARDGDRNAFGELVRRHSEELSGWSPRMCGDAGLAEDAAQEAFMRAWVNLPSYQPKGSLRNWLDADRDQRGAGCPAARQQLRRNLDEEECNR